ncbi:hypothetical protein Z517_11393 [Fonsecaea pedrosoi CBS 271.37]|uniref:Uncharacterized protein n=1 Tax=Fonsecaea pedrosoi CBS 271.37 TaxID=1442368 RepID=A0A0D2G1F8_9EURO|nr:uncharacterized protein Z517_11393 [Fonsecaea pedrosoi CBS 271.37]KIW74623.1 hypothetical protein Z517_11393 [Fonsecaea pedrosoi CBS 271.37]
MGGYGENKPHRELSTDFMTANRFSLLTQEFQQVLERRESPGRTATARTLGPPGPAVPFAFSTALPKTYVKHMPKSRSDRTLVKEIIAFANLKDIHGKRLANAGFWVSKQTTASSSWRQT